MCKYYGRSAPLRSRIIFQNFMSRHSCRQILLVIELQQSLRQPCYIFTLWVWQISLFLLTWMSCQGSHLSQYRSYFPSLYRKSKTQKIRILMSCKKIILNKISKISKNTLVAVVQLHSMQRARSCWEYVPELLNEKFSSNFQYLNLKTKKKRRMGWKRNGAKSYVKKVRTTS